MFTNKVEVLNMARAMARHAAAQHVIVARNIANADTPGYRTRNLASFAEVWKAGGTALRATRVGHLSGAKQITAQVRIDQTNSGPNENSVSLEAEMIKAVEARQAHDMALAIHRSLSGNIRNALGRR